MALEAYISLGTVPVYLSILGMYALAVWLMYLAPGNRAHRSFSVVLFLWAGAALAQTLFDVHNRTSSAGSAATTAGLNALVFVSGSMLLFALAWFVSVYPSERGPLAGRRGRWSLLLAGLTVPVLFVVKPGLWRTYVFGSDGSLVAAHGIGPLYLVLHAAVAGTGIAGFLLARAHAGSGPGRRRRSIFLVALGFLLYGLYRGLNGALDWFVAGGSGMENVPAGLAGTDVWLYVVGSYGLYLLAFPLVLWGAWLLLRDASPDPGRRRSTRAMLLVLYAAALALGAVRQFASLPRFVTLGLVNLTFPLLATYALVRHQLFGIDLRVNWTVKQSTVAGVFVAVFFAASEGAQVLFADFAGNEIVGVAAAALLVFAIAPLQRVGERVANAAVPPEQAAAPVGEGDPEETYRHLAEQAWADGALERSERGLLDRARESLGLDRETAMRIEQEASEEAGE